MTEREQKIVDLFNDETFTEMIVKISKSQGNRNRINHCTAWYVPDMGRKWIVSYETVVGCYDDVTETLYSFGRYSATTYQHIRKFRNDYTANGCRTREINLNLVDNYGCYNNFYRDNTYYKNQHKA